MTTLVPRLIATDLDGTLLRPDLTVSERSRSALGAAQQTGVVVVLVTARPPRFVHPLAASLGLSGRAICCNGGLVTDLATGEILEHTALSAEIAMDVVRKLRIALPDVCFAIERGLQYGCEPGYLELGRLSQPQDDEVADALTLCAEPVTKLIARSPTLHAAELFEITAPLVDTAAYVCYSGPRFVEISAPGVDKAAALARLCQGLGITAEEVVAFGDMPNDAPMLRWAGLGVAVANAHAEALTAANVHTDANTDDGVARVIERLLGIDQTAAPEATSVGSQRRHTG